MIELRATDHSVKILLRCYDENISKANIHPVKLGISGEIVILITQCQHSQTNLNLILLHKNQ